MEPPIPASDFPPRRSFGRQALAFFSGFGLATTLLVLLGILTWLATLEQIDSGLHLTLRKYFDWRAPIVLPEINGVVIPVPLPGGYWACALLLVNLTLGGVLRLRKGWRHAGVIISHFGIILLLVAGGVSHHDSERGYMVIPEGASSNVARDYFEPTVEIAEITAGKPGPSQVIRGRYLTDLTDGSRRLCRLSAAPFDLELSGFLPNADVVSARRQPPSKKLRVHDGYYLQPKQEEKDAEANTPACTACVRLRDGSRSEPFLLAVPPGGQTYQPFTLRHQDRIFIISLCKRQWLMPFTLKLDKFTAEFHPGTMKPKAFESRLTRLENGAATHAKTSMNEPMRHAGLTFYQAKYVQTGNGPNATMATVLEVVRNPADQWPKYCLYIVTFGLLVHFITKLALHIARISRPQAND